jgi:hypothetical protein
MAATALTVTEYALHGGAQLTWESSDVTLGNSFVNTGREIILVKNGDSVSREIRITAVDDPKFARATNKTVAVAAGEVALIGPLRGGGWNQTDGTVLIAWELSTPTATKIRVVRVNF